MELRYYQKETLAAIAEAYKEGIRQQLVFWCTGAGKTLLAANLPTYLKGTVPNGKMLFIAHTEELLNQAMDKIKTWNPQLKVGLEKAEHHADPDCDVIVACNASVGRSGSKRLDNFWNDISIIVLDECHRQGDTYLRILNDSGVFLPESKKLLVGLSATPKSRSKARGQAKDMVLLDDEDTVSLKSIFKKIVYSYPLRKAIADGFLVPLKGIRVDTKTSLDEVKVVAGEFKSDELSTAVNTPERNSLVVKAWKDNAVGRPTIAFTAGIDHAKALAEEFLRNGVCAAPIYGVDVQRASKLIWFEEGKLEALCNASLLIEGFDSTKVSCIVLATPDRSSSRYTQKIGRGTRLHPGKEDCLVIDICDSYKRCSLITLPSLFGMNPAMNLHGGSVLAAEKELSDLQEKYPTVNLSNLTDLSKIKAYIESIDLFAEPYTEEVQKFSKLGWISGADGSYILSIPERQAIKGQYSQYLHEKLHLEQNELDEWELSISTTKDTRKLGTFGTLKEAFETADDVVRRCRPERLKLLTRESEWKNNPATEAVKKYLRTLSKNKPLLKCICVGIKPMGTPCAVCKQMPITAGEASLAIDLLKNQRSKK
jgi:ATP-dependent helicase IRC3